MQLNLRRLLIFLLILALSVGFGFGFDAAMTAMEKHDYPLHDTYAQSIRQNADTYGVPESILWAVVQTESNFQSNLVGEDGSIGLMQLTPAEFTHITTQILGEEASEEGMLYYPEKNLQCGAAYLSYLYQKFGVWETVFAAYAVGEDTVSVWLTDENYSGDRATLKHVPSDEVAAYVAQVAHAHRLYTKLYFAS